ncbi:hypothetical protein CgunFtcFv8_014347 [Champsocephalus gunnari]|uniref:THAP-type domain-containing protein n=1 Tax=Champsocephalus gunnari TaxID=52237 RepID=A0AAN8E6C2_CHAGU|nr:hypothetical protein CgunFtcFv8_014347 [Champsocephalus gunnari]
MVYGRICCKKYLTMPDFCAAYGCSNHRSLETRTRGITFHVFPKTKERRRQWELALRRDGFVSCDRTLLCSEHFRSEEFGLKMVLCQQYSTSQLIFKGRKQQEAQPLQEERKMNLSLML